MGYAPLKAGTILIPSGTYVDPDKMHLFVICTDVCPKGMQIYVPISTYREKISDETCLLEAFEHSFLKHKSFILYLKSEMRAQDAIIRGVEDGRMKPHDVMNNGTFLKVRKGIVKSKRTPLKIVNYFNELSSPPDPAP